MKLILCIFWCIASFSSFGQDETADVHTYGGGAFEEGRQILQTSDGTYALIGTTGSIDGNTEILLMKLNANLDCQWSAIFGNDGVDKGMSICKGDNDNLILCGYGVDPILGDYNVQLIKVDAAGNEIWSKYVGNSNWDFGYKVIPYAEGYVVVGKSYGNDNIGSDATLWFFDQDGNLINSWIWDIGGEEVWNDVDLLEDNSILTTGSDGSALIIRKWNAEGGEEWTYTKTIENQDLSGVGSDVGNNTIYFSGIEDLDGLERAIRGQLNMFGVEMFFQEINLDNDFYFGEPFVYEELVAYPGMTKNYGAGGSDACVFMFGTNNSFIGAPTFGGELEEFMYSGIVDESGAIISVGSYTSFSEGVEQIGVIRLSAFYSGDYIKTFDYSGDCVSYLPIQESEIAKSCGKCVSSKYFDLLGQILEDKEVFDSNRRGLYLREDLDERGCRSIHKILIQ